MSNTRQRFPLSPKKITKKTIEYSIYYIVIFGSLSTMFVMGIGGILAEAFHFNFGIVILSALVGDLALVAIIVATVHWYQSWYYATYFYDLTPDFIIIRKGPITPREITIPYERVQDVYVDQDILDRTLGLYDVHLSSATVSSGNAAHIDGVEKETADGLKVLLLEMVSKKIGKTKS